MWAGLTILFALAVGVGMWAFTLAFDVGGAYNPAHITKFSHCLAMLS